MKYSLSSPGHTCLPVILASRTYQREGLWNIIIWPDRSISNKASMNFSESRPWCDLNLRPGKFGSGGFWGIAHQQEPYLDSEVLWYKIDWTRCIYFVYYRFDWGWLSKMYRFLYFFWIQTLQWHAVSCWFFRRNGGRGVAGGMNGGWWMWGLMTLRRYESTRCQEEVIRITTTWYIYIYIYYIYIW